MPVTDPNVAPANYTGLLSSLLKAGVVSNTCTLVGAGATVKEDKAEPDNVANLKELRDYIVNQSVLCYRSS